VSVKREAGTWYALCSGDHLGLTAFATRSDGTEIATPRQRRSAPRRLRIAQRRVARRQTGGTGRRTAVRLLPQAHAQVQHQRADFHHRVSRALVTRDGLLVVDELKVRGRARSRLARSVHDGGWAAFLAKLDYKVEGAGRRVVRVHPAGTTQRWSACGDHVPKTLRQRWHACPTCELSLARAENAARAILRLGPIRVS
jgi:putative transposase